MSVIGPRPGLWNQDVLTAERDKYGANDVKPGLTGWAQINGRDELEIPDKAKLDGEYCKNISFKMDAKVFLGSLHVFGKDDSVVEGGTGEMKKTAGRNYTDGKSKEELIGHIGFGEPVEIDKATCKKVLITGAGSYIGEFFCNYAKEHYPSLEIETLDISMFSFHATKVFNTIEGGCVCFKNSEWITLLNDMKNFGIHGPESVEYVGGNAKMNEFQAAMGICNLRHLDSEIQKRRRVVERYRERLSEIEGIKLAVIQRNVESNYAYFPVVFDGYKYTRNEIFERLAEQGISARKYFYPLTNSFSCYRNYPTAGVEKTPIAQHIALRVLTLPLYAELSLDDVDRICDIILK